MTLAEAAPARRTLAGRVQKDLPCFGCGYNLRGLDRSGACPECGESIAAAVQEDALALADAAWLRTLRRGAATLLVGLVLPWLSLAVGVVLMVVPFTGGGGIAAEQVTTIGVCVLFLLPVPLLLIRGIDLFTAAEPRETARQVIQQRRLARWGTMAAAVLWTFAVVAVFGSPWLVLAAVVFAMLGSIAGLWGLTHWIEELTRRAPDRRLRRRAGQLRGLAALSGMVVGIGPLVVLGDLVLASTGRMPRYTLSELAGVLAMAGFPLGVIGLFVSHALLLGVLDQTRLMLGRALAARDAAAARAGRNTVPPAASLRV